MSKKTNTDTTPEQNLPKRFKDTFDWTPDMTPKLFPIDPSVNELNKKYGWPNRAIDRHLIDNPLIKDTLDQLIRDESHHKSYSAKRPLPLEAMPFLECFFSMRAYAEYKPLFRDYTKRDKPYVDMKQFTIDFCRELHDHIFPPPQPGIADPNAYCRHVLFENSTFTSVVLNELWKNQINRRLAVIQSLLTGETPSLQMEILGECLLALDQCIARFSIAEPPSSAGINSDRPIAEMLEQLLSARKKMQTGTGREKSYCIKNSKFFAPSTQTHSAEETNLENAFGFINNRFLKPTQKYIEAARISYLQELASEVSSKTELEYTKVDYYLSQITNSTNTQHLQSSLAEWVKDWCIAVINSCFSDALIWDKPELDFSNFGYVGDLIQHLVSIHVSKSLKIFDDTFNIIRTFSMVSVFCRYANLKEGVYTSASHVSNNSELYHLLSQQEQDLSYNFSDSLFAHIHAAWYVLFGPEPTLFFDDHRINIPLFTQKFCPAVQDAMAHFKLQLEWTDGIIAKHLTTYNDVITHANRNIAFSTVLDGNLCLLKSFILLLLQQIQDDCVHTALTALSFISSQLSHIGEPEVKEVFSQKVPYPE